MKSRWLKWGFTLTLKQKKLRITEINKIMAESDFWDDASKAQMIMKELTKLKSIVDEYNRLKTEYEDVATLIQIGYEENDESLLPEIEESLNKFVNDLEELRLKTLLSGEYDSYNAILTLHAGAGSTESCDWASMLLRMYQRWADKRGFSTQILDFWTVMRRA